MIPSRLNRKNICPHGKWEPNELKHLPQIAILLQLNPLSLIILQKNLRTSTFLLNYPLHRIFYYVVIIFVTGEIFMTGGNKRKTLNISMPPGLYREVEKLAKEQAKAKGEFVREVIRQYVETHRRWKQIRKR